MPLMSCSVSGFVIPGRMICAPAVSRITRAPFWPQRLRSCAVAVRHGDDLDALAAGVGQPLVAAVPGMIWVTSSRAISIGRGRRPPGDQLPASPAV